MTIRWRWGSDVESERSMIAALAEERASAQADAARWEAIAHQLEQTIDGAKVMLACSEERYADLLARYHMLKLQGFSEPAPPVARPQVHPDPIKRAIAQRAGTNRQLREAMERQVATDRLMGKSDEEILSAIIAGVSGEDLILSEAGLMSP